MNHIAKWKTFSKEEFEQMLKESRSWSELAGKLGYVKTGGGTISSLKKAVKEYNLDTSHFLGQAWNRENYDYSSFEKNSYKKNGSSILAPLVKLRGRKCESCGLTEWMEKPINLEVHHINGDRSDNRLENLQILCPNCHSYTPNFRKRKKDKVISDEDFIYALKNNKSIHAALKFLGLVPSSGNYVRARELIHKNNIEHLFPNDAKLSTRMGNYLSE